MKADDFGMDEKVKKAMIATMKRTQDTVTKDIAAKREEIKKLEDFNSKTFAKAQTLFEANTQLLKMKFEGD